MVALGAVRSRVVVMLLLICFLIVTPNVGFGNCSIFCCVLLCVHSGFVIIWIGNREQLVALLCLSQSPVVS